MKLWNSIRFLWNNYPEKQTQFLTAIQCHTYQQYGKKLTYDEAKRLYKCSIFDKIEKAVSSELTQIVIEIPKWYSKKDIPVLLEDLGNFGYFTNYIERNNLLVIDWLLSK